MADLSPHFQKRLLDEIYAAASAGEEPRKNGPELMALACDRALWLGLNGAKALTATGARARAAESARLARRALLYDLRRAGYKIEWNSSLDCGAIFGLSRRPRLLDIAVVPEGAFRRLTEFGLSAAIDLEIALHCRLGLAGFTMALFVAENKNTQELYCEKICFDREIFEEARERADELLARKEAPAGNFDENCFSCCFLGSCRV